MWLPVMVLVMMGSTGVIAGLDDHVLPPLARWGWWTLTLWACGVASIYAPYNAFHWRALGLISVSLFYVSYPLLWDTYILMMPVADNFAWPEVFVLANIILPLVMVTIGPTKAAVKI